MSFEVDFEEDENFGLGGAATGNGGFDATNGTFQAHTDGSNGAAQSSGMDHDHHSQQQQQADGDRGAGAAPQATVSAAAAIALQDAKESNSGVYIANLQWWTTDAEIEAACAPFGQVTSIKFMEDRANGKSRGCALVEFTEPEAAVRCKEELHGRPFNGRNCMCTFPNRGMPKLSGVGPPSIPPWSASNSATGGRGGGYPNNPNNPSNTLSNPRDGGGGNFPRGGGAAGRGGGRGGGRFGNGPGMQQEEMMRQEQEFMRQQEFMAMQGGGMPNPAMLDQFMMVANMGMGIPPMGLPGLPFGMPPAFPPFGPPGMGMNGPGMGNFGFGQ